MQKQVQVPTNYSPNNVKSVAARELKLISHRFTLPVLLFPYHRFIYIRLLDYHNTNGNLWRELQPCDSEINNVSTVPAFCSQTIGHPH